MINFKTKKKNGLINNYLKLKIQTEFNNQTIWKKN